jgi:dolichol-phosphate mannosyltransferase
MFGLPAIFSWLFLFSQKYINLFLFIKPMDISIVLPTYNERKNIEILIPQLEELLKKENLSGEIVVVDDTSPDGTADVAKELNKRYGNINVVVRSKKEGLGAALREGYNRALGDIIFSMDSDLPCDPNNITKFLEKLTHYDLVVGSRHSSEGGYEMKSFKTSVKWLTSRSGNFALRLMSGIKISDFSMNVRGIRKDAWKSINTTSNSNFFMFETILLAKSKGLRISEIPFTFKDRVYGESKLKLSKEAPSFFVKAFKLSLKHRLGML